MPSPLQIIYHHLKETHQNLQMSTIMSTIGKELLIRKNTDRSKMHWIRAENNIIIIDSYDHNSDKSTTNIDLNKPNSLTEISQTIEK